MQNIIKAIINFFKGKEADKVVTAPYSLGAILNEPDNRDIPYEAVAGLTAPIYPAQITVAGFLTTTRLLQGQLGTCVVHTFEFIKRLADSIIHSRRVPYVITRNVLGMTEADGEGLPQREAAKTMTVVGTPKDIGIDINTLAHSVYASLPITQSMRDNANLYKFGGFAFPAITVNGFKQALANGKAVAVTIGIDWNKIDPDGTVHPVVTLNGYHETALGSCDDATGKFRLANWWGYDLYINYSELAQVVKDAIVFTDIPDDLKLRAQQMQFKFVIDLAQGAKSSTVGQLQKRLIGYGLLTGNIDNSYGPNTMQAVMAYQKLKGITMDGKVGPNTRAQLNADAGNAGLSAPTTDNLLNAIIAVETGGNDNAVGDKTIPNHAYGVIQIRQGVCDQVNAKFKTTYKAQDCLGDRAVSVDIWNKYWQVYTNIITDEDRSRSWNGGPGWRNIYNLPVKDAAQIEYCHNIDVYWEKVQKYL